VRQRSLCSMRSSTFSQWRDLRMGVQTKSQYTISYWWSILIQVLSPTVSEILRHRGCKSAFLPFYPLSFCAIYFSLFLPRDATQERHVSSCGICLSVCLSRSYILSKRIYVSSNFFHHRVAIPF